MSILFLWAFLLAISIVFSAFKTPWRDSLLAQLPKPPQLQFSNESILIWLLLSTVHSTTLALNTCHLYCILIYHRVNFVLPPSISSPNIVSTLLLSLEVFDKLALPFGIPSLIISDLPTLTLSSNQI